MQTSQPVNTVLIDDSDPGIQYGPGWVNKPSLLAQSDPKYPMYGTLHETLNQSNLTYSFSGSSITACARVIETQPSAQTLFGVLLWTCSVDSVQISSDVGYATRGNYVGMDRSICCTLTVELNPQVQHEIYISAKGSQDQRILFDYLIYETSLAVPVADLLILPDDPTFRNIEGWEAQYSNPMTMDIDAIVSTEPKANFTYDFYGSSIL
ncbi:hypothetical protein GALMADRAFT_795226 [Galerina marginata CBS 339.88]|uniref:Uncharacterized protein n=1 Tax=Galerina marginata (strain CBS 339.88) TaxID=685588 RepID=A0A067SVC3_GALM3|nr:hypothetical protein GALMADRAFT_795226 [Galerina marginata CBS 339.88]